jgi:hypothetical protein
MSPTCSLLSKKSPIQDCIHIEANPLKNIVNKTGICKSIENLNSSGQKATVIDMFEHQEANKTQRVSLTYTIKHGDDKRMDKNGFIKVYDLNEEINIPVGRLLGKWKITHIGVTLVVINNKWRIEGEVFKTPPYKPEVSMRVAFQRLFKFVTAQ